MEEPVRSAVHGVVRPGMRTNPVGDLWGIAGREEWMLGAPCATTDVESFFPETGGSSKPAKTVCAGCDVRERCLQYALDQNERFGIWGGLSERERRKLRRGENVTRREPQRTAPSRCRQCGKDFFPNTTGIYCSKRCGNRASYERTKARRDAA